MKLKKAFSGLIAAAMIAAAVPVSGSYSHLFTDTSVSVSAAESVIMNESCFMTWTPVSGANGYNVYVKAAGGSYTKIDSMLIRQYNGYYRADAVGLKAGTYSMKAVPLFNGNEDNSKAIEQGNLTVKAYDRTGFGWVNGTSSGAYNEDGTLRSNAVVLYVTEQTKNTVSMDVVTDGKGTKTNAVGIQNIINLYKKGYETRPLDIRVIGQVTDPATLEGGDLVISGSGSDAAKRIKCGITIEGIGNDAVFRGFGIRLKNLTNCEIRNMAIMLVDSSEGDNYSLQQDCDHIWVHNCDSFYGEAGGDADQAKGDGALDCKKSTYITFSYNHFWDNGKCNLLGLKEGTTDGLYITYHHNWYDHSDSRHPRVRFYSAHVYNNYYDGNAKYGIGSTLGSSILSENNYFRNCKYPMLTSMQGSDVATGGTFSSEDGGTIKAVGNYMTGQKAFVPYSENNTDFDAYVVSSQSQQVPNTVKSKKGSNTYNNFDTNSSVMYKWTAEPASSVPATVTANAGRQGGGDFRFAFNNSVDDEAYNVNQSLMSALRNYKSPVVAIGSGFSSDAEQKPIETQPAVTTAAVTQAAVTTATQAVTQQTQAQQPASGTGVIYCSPSGGSNASGTQNDPMDVLTAIKKVQAGGTIYLLGGTYKFSSTIKIEESNAGSAGKYKTIAAYPGANVRFDFSGESVSNSSYGFILDGSYWHFYGFEIANAGDNGMLLSGDNNIVEMMVFNGNQDTGLQISRSNTNYNSIAQWPTSNLVKNCTSKNNCDDATMENADGFAAKLTCGQGNVFDGCISYNNSDDGWDLYAKEATGPIGVVTIKNCIAFRNGFTESGKGYGNCDGNGFKLGGGAVGTRHVVENCLAFENLNCGFTDNNNPEFGVLKNCTAYNNGIGGNGKANYYVYRCSASADLQNLVTYYNTGKVSKTNAAGIKVANDKFKGTLKNSLYYNSKYYYNSGSLTCDGSSPKSGDIVTPSDSDFITLNVGAMGTDFHKTWRNSDGSPKPAGFAETNGTYKALGYHMASGVSQTATPNVYAGGGTVTPPVETTTNGGGQTVTTTTTTAAVVVPVAGAYKHDFTANGTSSTFYTISGNLSTSKGTVNADGKTLTQCLKMETATSITFNAPSAGKLTLVFVEPTPTIKIDGTKYTSSGGGIIEADLSAGSHSITKADTANLFYMAYGTVVTPQPETTTTTSATTTTTTTSETAITTTFESLNIPEETTTTTTTTKTPVTEPEPTTAVSETTFVTNEPVVITTTTSAKPSTDPTSPTETQPVPVTVTKYGDIDTNGLVELADVTCLAKYLLNPTSFPLINEQAQKNADITRDGIVNALDLSRLIEFNLGKISADKL